MTKEEFIRQTLKIEADKFRKNHTATIREKFYSKDTGQTNTLLSDRVVTSTDDRITFKFPHYLRQQDLRRTFLNGRGRVSSRSGNVYNRFIYGIYFSIAEELMYGYTEEVANEITQQ